MAGKKNGGRKAAKGAARRALQKNTGLLGGAFRALRSRSKMIEMGVEGRRKKK